MKVERNGVQDQGRRDLMVGVLLSPFADKLQKGFAQIEKLGLTPFEAKDGVPSFSISGFPEKVDQKNVLFANGSDAFGNTFMNTIKAGSEMMIAEPGTLLVGPDFDPKKVVEAKGHTEYISPVNQVLLASKEPMYIPLPEGQFVWATAGKMTAKVGDFTVQLDGEKGHNWFLIVRGLFADGKQDVDKNSTIEFTGYVPGHAQAMVYPAGAYVSEGNFLQVAEKSHSNGRNCGQEGCSRLSVFMFDVNTGAYDVIHQTENQGQINASWKQVANNWLANK